MITMRGMIVYPMLSKSFYIKRIALTIPAKYDGTLTKLLSSICSFPCSPPPSFPQNSCAQATLRGYPLTKMNCKEILRYRPFHTALFPLGKGVIQALLDWKPQSNR